ncbi:MAG: hypothetical protein H2184_09390 [Candidatus Galacturonibacter soehngenii]|nr:hypothetical protein [Candidatus Galacturonibacter soehngenii]
MLILTITFTAQLTALAADTTKTVTSSKAMSIALNPGTTGNSNTITFNFSSLPSNAIVKEIKVDASNASAIGGLGAILAQTLTITSPVGETKTVTWGRGNVTSTSAFIADSARGTWSIYMTGTNVASASSGSQFIGGTKYLSVKMTITYVLE